MALRDVVKEDNSIIRKRSRKVDIFDSKLHKLLDDMKETMEKEDGVGLAGVQVGFLRRLAIILDEEENIVEFINPVILSSEGEQIGPEGCLSVEGRNCNVLRPYKLTLRAQDRYGEYFEKTYEGFDAVKCCHEFDHFEGILFYDKEFIEEEK